MYVSQEVRENGVNMLNRPIGVSSIARLIEPRTGVWTSPSGVAVPMPIGIDLVMIGDDGRMVWLVDTVVDQRQGQLVLLTARFESANGLDPKNLQLNFRWQTPIDITTHLLPTLIGGSRPLHEIYLPLDGYPEVILPNSRPYMPLTDEFLGAIVRNKRFLGRGYAKTLAAEKGVSVRTVVSWVEKAKKRGII